VTEAELKERSDRLRSTEQRLARAEARIVVQTQTIEEAGRTVEAQRGEMVAFRAEIGSLRSQVTNLERTARLAQSDGSDAATRAETAESSLAEARTAITGLSAEVHLLQQNLATQNAAVDTLQRTESSLRAELAETTALLEAEIDELSAGKLAAETALAEHRQRLTALAREHVEAQADLTALRLTEAELRETLEATINRYQAQVDGLAAQLAAKIARSDAEAKALAAGKTLAEGQLEEHKRQLAEVTRERNQAQAEVTLLRRTDAEKTQRLTSLERHYESTISALTTDKAFMEGQLSRTREERTKLQRALSDLKQESDAGWQAERKENALLRDRVNEVAAQITQLTAALEGAESPIHALIAGEAGSPPPRARGSRARTGSSGAANGVPKASGSLADRIRALQSSAEAKTGTISAAS